jgi:long-chain acyl-CoA synthetase
MVADGYLGNSQATAATFPDGWLATGDLVKCDASGNYSIVGRKKNVILRGGFTIYPAEVEEAIEALEGVFCAVVFARENDVKGEEICAYVACRTEQDAAARNALIAAVRKDLGAFRAPDRFHFTTHAPATNSAGKIRIESLLAYFDDQAPVPLVGGVS